VAWLAALEAAASAMTTTAKIQRRQRRTGWIELILSGLRILKQTLREQMGKGEKTCTFLFF
jgi:predicted nucleic acid-binding protein